MGNGFRLGSVALVVFACGGSVGGGQGERCPVADPRKAQRAVTCATEGLVCTYGDQPTTCGRVFAACKGGRFELSVYVCLVTPSCPREPPADGSSCTLDCGGSGVGCVSGSCTYPRGVFCACGTEPPGWFCSEPLADTRCPDFMPNLGASCSVEGASCNYNHCGDDGMAMTCTGGMWTYDGGVPCFL